MKQWRIWLILAVITAVGLWLRLLAWHWNALRPLGGDEREYYELALSIARRQGYYDLQFMRPPLFPWAMAVVISLFTSDLHFLRLINALVSTATIPAIYWWTRQILPERRSALLAASGTAVWYSLAFNATELLTEAVTLLGLVLSFGLLVYAQTRHWRWAAAAGVLVALVCLTRSVALPLVPLGAWWLWRSSWRTALIFVAATVLVIAPWSIRNTLTYGSFILIDTTGPENIWLDNDPAGREAVKAQLYALGADRTARAELATEQGLAAIRNNPRWFLAKSWREFQLFWAWEHTDDMLARPALWVPAAEAWLRVLFGDGGWVVLVLLGSAGLVLMPLDQRLRLVLIAWVLYIVATNVLFHVEFRYRLPLLPALAPAAAWSLIQGLRQMRAARRAGFRQINLTRSWAWRCFKLVGVVGPLLLLLGAHGYLNTFGWLVPKHVALWQSERALADAREQPLPSPRFPAEVAGSLEPVYLAQAYAATALQYDPDSVVARTLQARAELILQNQTRAEALLREAIAILPAHPYAHLLLGDLLRAQGKHATAELAFETASREDLQHWAWINFNQTPLPAELAPGQGADLGFIQGFYAANQQARWIGDQAQVRLAAAEPPAYLELELRAPTPTAQLQQQLDIMLDQQFLATIEVEADWHTVRIPLPPAQQHSGAYRITLDAAFTWQPHAYDRFNPDNRELGVELRQLRLGRE